MKVHYDEGVANRIGPEPCGSLHLHRSGLSPPTPCRFHRRTYERHLPRADAPGGASVLLTAAEVGNARLPPWFTLEGTELFPQDRRPIDQLETAFAAGLDGSATYGAYLGSATKACAACAVGNAISAMSVVSRGFPPSLSVAAPRRSSRRACAPDHAPMRRKPAPTCRLSPDICDHVHCHCLVLLWFLVRRMNCQTPCTCTENAAAIQSRNWSGPVPRSLKTSRMTTQDLRSRCNASRGRQMTQHGDNPFCPVAMAAEVLCTRWTVVLLRELVAGSTRFNDLRRGVPKMSPTLLSQRLKELELAGAVERTELKSEKGVFEYRLTESGKDLRAVVEAVGFWGQKWSRPASRSRTWIRRCSCGTCGAT